MAAKPTETQIQFNLSSMRMPTTLPPHRQSKGELEGFEYLLRHGHLFDGLERCGDPEITPPVPTPTEGDWLWDHATKCQTFESFLSAKGISLASKISTRATPLGPALAAEGRVDASSSVPSETIVLCILGSGLHPSQVTALQMWVEAFYQLHVVVVKVDAEKAISQGLIRSRVHSETGKRQLWACDCQKYVKQSVEQVWTGQANGAKPLLCVMGITMEDLTKNADWNFLYGLASLTGRMGVFSLHRFSPEFNHEPVASEAEADAIILRRACKVVCHELGHIFGLKHCVNHSCLMNGVNHVGELEQQRLMECPCCTKKLAFSCRWDLEARYVSLEKAATNLGFSDVSQWIAGHMLPTLKALQVQGTAQQSGPTTKSTVLKGRSQSISTAKPRARSSVR